MKTYAALPPRSSREEVEALHAAHRLAAAAPRSRQEGPSLKPAPRVDGIFHDISFTPTESTSTIDVFAKASGPTTPADCSGATEPATNLGLFHDPDQKSPRPTGPLQN